MDAMVTLWTPGKTKTGKSCGRWLTRWVLERQRWVRNCLWGTGGGGRQEAVKSIVGAEISRCLRIRFLSLRPSAVQSPASDNSNCSARRHSGGGWNGSFSHAMRTRYANSCWRRAVTGFDRLHSDLLRICKCFGNSTAMKAVGQASRVFTRETTSRCRYSRDQTSASFRTQSAAGVPRSYNW